MKSKFKSDTIQLYVTINTDITNWKIRAEIFDNSGSSVKLATSNSGGSNSQISKSSISETTSVFIIYIPSASTTNFDDKSFIEIEVDTGNIIGGLPEIVTIFRGNITLLKEQITWTTP